MVWFAAEAPDGRRGARGRRARRHPNCKCRSRPWSDGGMGQTLGELAAALRPTLGRRDALSRARRGSSRARRRRRRARCCEEAR